MAKIQNQIIQRGSAAFKYGFAKPDQLEKWMLANPEIIGVSFVGRSNVGKSSLINTLFGNKTARVSKTPGRTRQVNIFEFILNEQEQPFYLFDLPGYGHAEVSKEMAKTWDELMGVFFELATDKYLMVNVQDARHPNQKADKEFHNFLAAYPLSTSLVFNKMDKLKKQKDRAALKKLKPQIFKEYKWVKDIHFVSAENGDGIEALETSMASFLLNKEQNQSVN